jgi:hypothetical protein
MTSVGMVRSKRFAVHAMSVKYKGTPRAVSSETEVSRIILHSVSSVFIVKTFGIDQVNLPKSPIFHCLKCRVPYTCLHKVFVGQNLASQKGNMVLDI